MIFPRRQFLGSSLVLLGTTLLDALVTPLSRWKEPISLQAPAATSPAKSAVTFVDVAHRAELTVSNVWGDRDHKKYIIEAKGSGLAFFDYDDDGWLDIYLTNGTKLDAHWHPARHPPASSTRTTATELLAT